MSFSGLDTLGVIRGSTPEALAEIISKVTWPIEILSFGQDGEFFAYYRVDKANVLRVQIQLEKAQRGISRGGEALS